VRFTAPQVADAAAISERLLRWSAIAHRVPGIAYGLSHDGTTVLAGDFGVADLAEARPVDVATTRFRCASITKTFTATLVLQQVERGRLRLDDPVVGWLGWTKGILDARLTLRHLLMHAGSVNRDGSNDWSDRTMPDATMLRAELRRSATFGSPSERFRYSNLGYALLGEVLEAATKRRFATLLRRDIATRLGMSATSSDLTAAARRTLATGYYWTWPGEAPRPAAQVEARAIAPAGGLVSTVGDLLAYQHAHLPGDPRLLTELSKLEMQRPQWQRAEPLHYGLGWMTWSAGGVALVGHSGGFPGFTTMVGFSPEHRLAATVLTNCNGSIASDGLSSIYEALGAVASFWPDAAAPSTWHSRAALERFAGVYRGHFGDLVVGRVNRALAVGHPEEPFAKASLLIAKGPLRFLVAQGSDFGFLGETIRFRRDRTGAVTTLLWGAHEMARTTL
jgi:CubicO group peptidase (beta-lactamase class C family)